MMRDVRYSLQLAIRGVYPQQQARTTTEHNNFERASYLLPCTETKPDPPEDNDRTSLMGHLRAHGRKYCMKIQEAYSTA